MKEKLEFEVTADTSKAQKGFKDLGSTVERIGSTIQKVTAKVPGLNKVIGPGLQSAASIGAGAIAGFATTAAGAIAKFASDSVSEFENLGVEIGKFRDATGVTAEQASRLIEVAHDLGIDAGTLEGALGKMNKAAATTPGVFQQAGAAIVYTKDGAVDANATFLNTVDALSKIEDPAQRAALASKIFGKSYQGLAEIIFGGSEKIKSSLAGVESQKIFDDAKIEKARKLRASFDSLHDSVEDLEISLGSALAPAIGSVAEAVAKVVGVTDPILHFNTATKEAAKNTGGWLGALVRGSQTLAGTVEDTLSLDSALKHHKEATKDATAATEDQTTALSQQSTEWAAAVQGMTAAADAQKKLDDAQVQKLVTASLAAYDAGKKLADSQEEVAQSNRDAASDSNSATLALFDLSKQMDAAQKSADAYKTALEELAGNFPSVETATIDYKSAVDDASAALLDQKGNLDKTKLGLDDNTKAGRDNLTTLGDLAGKAFELQGAQKKAGASTDELSGLLAFQRQDFIKTAEKMGATATQAEQLADKYGLIPKNVQTAVKQVGLEDVESKLDGLRGKLSQPMLQYVDTLISQGKLDEANNILNGFINAPRTITIGTRVVGVNKFGDILDQKRGPRALGGPVEAGLPYTVGETGRETFIPATNGTIVPHGRGVGGSTVYNSTVNQYFPAGVDPNAVARAERRHLRRTGS